MWVLPGVMQGELSDFKRSANVLDATRAPSFDAAAVKESAGMLFLKPGESVRIARPPERVEWDLDLSLTLAWSSQGALIDKVEEEAPGYGSRHSLQTAPSIVRSSHVHSAF